MNSHGICFELKKPSLKSILKPSTNPGLAEYVKSKPEFQHEAKEFFKHKKPNHDPIEEMKKKKCSLNKKAKSKNATEEDKLEAKECIRMYNYLLKLNKEKEEKSRSSNLLINYGKF